MTPELLAVIVGAVLVAALARIWIPVRGRDRLDGWWHQQQPRTQRWTPQAWAQAAELSAARSRERRNA